MQDLRAISQSLLGDGAENVSELVQAAVARGVAPERILLESLVPAMPVIGRRLYLNPRGNSERVGSRAIHEALDALSLEPPPSTEPTGKVAVSGGSADIFFFAETLVSAVLRMEGFVVMSMECEPPDESYVHWLRQHVPDVVCFYTVHPDDLQSMKQIIERIRSAGLEDIRIMLSGAAMSLRFADELGVEGFASDVGEIAMVARELMALSATR